MEKKKALQWLGIFTGMELIAVLLAVFVFDPFYQYHDPLPGMKSVLYDRDNQVIGTVRNFSYDTVLLGSSLAENFDSGYIDGQFQARTVKMIRSNGSAADLLYFMGKAHEKQEIKQVFWCMDIYALEADTKVTLTRDELPNFYLYTESILDDSSYLFNKEILLEKIPKMLHDDQYDIHTGGHAYDWSGDMEFSAKRAMSAYLKPASPTLEERRKDAASLKERDAGTDPSDVPFLKENLDMVLKEIKSHPDTVYTIFFPPHSMLWWDGSYVSGEAEKHFAVLQYALPALLSCENVEIYYFQDEKEIICNLDNYMDRVHYSAEINQYMLECIAEGKNRVTKENVEEILSSMQDLYAYIITEGIYRYYD